MAKPNTATSADALLAKLGGRNRKKAKGLPKRAGKRKAKFSHYYSVVNPERKLRHLLKRNGRKAASDWADVHNEEGLLKKLSA